jgi:YesN/AraC family two-component response regulator
VASILIVDDEEVIRSMVCEILASDHTCQAAGTAERALECLDTKHYDLVLTDVSMPGLSGLELFGRIRQRQPDTPVIVISGISDLEFVRGLIQMGVFHYLMKPFKLEDIEQAVSSALEHRQQMLQARQAHSPLVIQPSSGGKSEQELLELERQWVEAYLRSNSPLLSRLWADDFVYMNAFREIKSKAQALESIESEMTFEHFITFDVHGNVFGDTAVATGRALVKGQYKGEDISGQYRYTNTYAQRQGRWQAIASHVARMQQP